MTDTQKATFKFVYVRHKIHPKCDRLHEGWYCLIDTEPTLHAYTILKSGKLGEEYLKLKDDVLVGNHINSGYKQIIFATLMDRPRLGRSIVDDVLTLHTKLLQPMVESFLRVGHLLISPNGSYRFMDETFTVLETVEREDFVFPDNKRYTQADVSITRWPYGRHYYLRICDVDYGKFNTYEYAQEESVTILSRLNNTR